MIVYNVTLSIHPEIEEEALAWLKEEHIPEVLRTNLFLAGNIFKVLEQPESKTQNSYAVQYKLESWEKYREYEEKHATNLKAKTKERFGELILSFRTFLETV